MSLPHVPVRAQYPMAFGLSDLLTSLLGLCKLSRAQGPRLPMPREKARSRSTSDVPCMPYHFQVPYQGVMYSIMYFSILPRQLANRPTNKPQSCAER